MHHIEHFVDFGAGEAVRSDIPNHLMRVSTIGDDLLTGSHQSCTHGSRIGNDLSTVLDEGWGVDLLELDGKRCNLMVVRATLEHGEHCEVDLFKERFLAEDDSGAGTSQGLVRR